MQTNLQLPPQIQPLLLLDQMWVMQGSLLRLESVCQNCVLGEVFMLCLFVMLHLPFLNYLESGLKGKSMYENYKFKEVGGLFVSQL